MATLPDSVQVQVSATDEFMAALRKTSEELKAVKEALSEERIRAIVREELIAIFSGMGNHTDEEEVFDTTSPDFVKNFKDFSNIPSERHV